MANDSMITSIAVKNRYRRPVSRTLYVLAMAFFFSCTLYAEVFADGMTGWLDYRYTDFDSESTEKATGNVTNTDSRGFRQLYGLTLDRRLYPNLRLFGNVVAEFQETDTTSRITAGPMVTETDVRQQRSVLRPYLDLTLRTPLYIIGGNVAFRKEHMKLTGAEPVTTYQIDKTAILEWDPENLPLISGRYRRSDSYDSNRRFRDVDADYVSLNSRYIPVQEVEFRYYGSYNKTTDNIDDTETRTTGHSGQINFSKQFFKRVDVYGSYELTHLVTEFESSGSGAVKLKVFAFQGLSSINDFPDVGALNPNPALIDGDKNNSAGINIGSSLPQSGDNRLRNLGLDFFSSEAVDTLFVSILSSPPQSELPSAVADTFVWEVFVSDNNLDWISWRSPMPAFFDPFQQRFEIEFPLVQSRYIKVAVRPLSVAIPDALLFPDIFVTEIEAFTTAQGIPGATAKFHSTGQIANFNSRVRLTEDPFIFYELSYFYRRTSSPNASVEEWTLSNGLSLNHRFTNWLRTTTRVAREDSMLQRGEVTAYVYNASLTAVPITTLTHTLTFSGRAEENPDGRFITNAVSLYNRAQLYQGWDAFLNGALSRNVTETDRTTDSAFVGAGTNIVPHRTIAVNLLYSDTETKSSGGGEGDFSSSLKRADASVSYTPLRTLFLFGSWSWVEQNSRTNRIQAYNLSWSPFPEGTLQISFSYFEDIRSENNSRNRTISPRVRWNFRPGMYLDVSYGMLKSESDITDSDTKVFATSLRISFL